MAATGENFAVLAPGPAHLFCPLFNFCALASFVGIPSHLYSGIPPSFASNPLVAVAQIAGSSGPRMRVSDRLNQPACRDLSAHLERPPGVLGAVVDFEVGWTEVVFWKDRRKSNFTEDEVIQWLDSKPRRSVLYVAFGSEELAQLAAALEKSTRAFIWVVGSKSGGDFADGMEGRVGDRGLIIRGWAPHLPIPSHPSTGGFLSHRGWNSMVEHRSPFGTRPFPGKRYYNTDSRGDDHKVDSRGDDHKVEHVPSNDMPKNVTDDESKGISKTEASEACASFQFDLKFQCRIGRLQIGASISRLARSMR